MSFYFSIFAILAFLSFWELLCGFPKDYKRIVVIFCSILFVFLSTFYYGHMGDYDVYKLYFENAKLSAFYDIKGNVFEYLYSILSSIIRVFTSNYVWLRFVLASIVMWTWYRVYNRTEYKKYELTIILILWCLNFENIFIIRSTVAVSLCVFSIKFIEEKDWKKFLIITIIATGFHLMSIIWILSYSIYHHKELKKYLYISIIFAAVFRNFIPQFVLKVTSFMGSTISHKVWAYISYGSERTLSTYNAYFITLKALANIILLIIIFEYIIFKKKKEGILKNEENMLNLYLTGSIVYMLALGSTATIARAAQTYNSVQYFLIPTLFDLHRFRNNIGYRLIAFVVLTIYLGLRLYIFVNSSGYIPFTIKI